MHKSISEDSHKLIKANRRSTRTNNQLKNVLVVIFLLMKKKDESPEYSGISDEDEINSTPLTSIFKIIPSEIDGNCHIHYLNSIVFD